LITAINSKINNKKKVQNFNYVNTPDEDQDYHCLTLLSTAINSGFKNISNEL
jgi:hypothetical protein